MISGREMASSDLYLSADQKDLLLAALNSNNPNLKNLRSPPPPFAADLNRRTSNQNYASQQPDFTSFDLNEESFLSNGSSNIHNTENLDDLDYELDFDITGDNYKFDVDGSKDDNKDGDHEKRKLSDDEGGDSVIDPHDAEPKRREGEEGKQAKKPGRKPLTSEPTTKRKAQNRAAQRAFRERKEKHLRDLEQKVVDLEKESETTNSENKRLKDQIDRLQTELNEYRKRMNINNGTNRSPSGSFSNSTKRLSGGNGIGGFSFDFPLFGQVGPQIHGGSSGLPMAPRLNSNGNNLGIKVGPGGLLMMDRGERKSASPIQPNSSSNQGNTGRSASVPNQSTKTNDSPVQVNKVFLSEPHLKGNDLNELSDLFSPSVLASVDKGNNSDYMSRGSPIQTISSMQSTPQLMDFATSPSASSVSQTSTRANNNNNNGPSSSCATSPESMNGNSPMTGKLDSSNNLLSAISEENNTDRLKLSSQLSRACGNSEDPIPKADVSLDWLTQQSGGSFEPLIFDDYRDPMEQINSGIGLSFFDDAFANSVDFKLPDSPAPENLEQPKKMKVPGFGDDEDDDDELVVPADDPKTMLNCNKICHHPAYQSGDLDMDGLCSQLRAKAKCSETGVVVGEQDVEAALKKLGEKMQQ